MNEHITRPVTMEELQRACFSMHPTKAPGPDRYTTRLFQRNWDIIKVDLFVEAESFFFGNFLLWELNKTKIALIPKVTKPELIS